MQNRDLNGQRDIPEWVAAWCARALRAVPVEHLLSVAAMSEVIGVRLDDGRCVVVKRRHDESGRARPCVEVQRILAGTGFPCPRPITSVRFIGDWAVHAEEWCPGGEVLRGDGPAIAEQSATLLADLMARLAEIHVDPPLPNVEWVRWDHDGPGCFPLNERHDARAERTKLPGFVEETACRVREGMRRHSLPCSLGHADWEAHNLRWAGREPRAVHDWDSLAWLPEAATVGAACGAFASTEVPTLAPLESSVAFLEAYQRARSRRFTAQELRVAWGASLWPALHNARAEALYDMTPVALLAVERQAVDRLGLAGG